MTNRRAFLTTSAAAAAAIGLGGAGRGERLEAIRQASRDPILDLSSFREPVLIESIELPGEKSWTWYPSYRCIFLCEYFLETGDKRVLKTIEELTRRLYLAQVLDPALYKDRMHGGEPQAKNFLKGGLGHGHRIAGYGTMTITTLLAMLSWELAEDCGVEIDWLHRDIAYEHSAGCQRPSHSCVRSRAGRLVSSSGPNVTPIAEQLAAGSCLPCASPISLSQPAFSMRSTNTTSSGGSVRNQPLCS